MPMTWPSAAATIEEAMLAANRAVRSSTSTGGSLAIPVRSPATAAKSSAIGRASAADAGLTVNSATGSCSHPGCHAAADYLVSETDRDDEGRDSEQ
jgi:hypothetical protein